MQGKHFNEFQYAADKKTSLIKMDLCIFFFISNVAFVSVHVTFPKMLILIWDWWQKKLKEKKEEVCFLFKV